MKNKDPDPILLHIQRSPLALIFQKRDEVTVMEISAEIAVVLAWELLNIPAVAGNFNQIAEALVIQKLQAATVN